VVNALTAANLPVICVETRHMKGFANGAANQQDGPQRCGRDRPNDAGRPVQAGACEDASCPGTAHVLTSRKLLDVEADLRGTLAISV
jgi:hypothetical protein